MRSSRRPIVLEGDPRPVHVYVSSERGRDGASGAATAPVQTWGGVVDRLRELFHQQRVRRVILVVVGLPPRIDREDFARIAELERAGLHVEWNAPAFAGGR